MLSRFVFKNVCDSQFDWLFLSMSKTAKKELVRVYSIRLLASQTVVDLASPVQKFCSERYKEFALNDIENIHSLDSLLLKLKELFPVMQPNR